MKPQVILLQYCAVTSFNRLGLPEFYKDVVIMSNCQNWCSCWGKIAQNSYSQIFLRSFLQKLMNFYAPRFIEPK